ncbi:unnamed protein product [Rotaria magnacalcarata]|nr:unnamed protein product [Rotaria magnacalcarata]CAF2115887.1 unnamed protein product [Rotaria magnacalcarata]
MNIKEKRVREISTLANEIPKNLKSHVVYQLSWNTCSEKYIGKTVRQACRRLKEHGAPQNINTNEPSQNLRRSERIAKNKKFQIYYGESDSGTDEEEVPQITTTSTIQQHMTSINHKIDWNNWLILDSDNHPYRLLVKESLAITENSPSLNRTTRSIPLVVYPEGARKRPTHNKTTS